MCLVIMIVAIFLSISHSGFVATRCSRKCDLINRQLQPVVASRGTLLVFPVCTAECSSSATVGHLCVAGYCHSSAVSSSSSVSVVHGFRDNFRNVPALASSRFFLLGR